MTDRDIIAKIRKDIDDGNTSEIGIAVRILAKYLWHYENANVEHMVTHLFDLSMKYTIGDVEAELGDWSGARAVNGHTYPIVQYKFTIVPSEDHQTNITPLLVDFLQAIVNPFVYDRVVPKRRNIMPRWDFDEWNAMGPFATVPHYYNRWEWLDEMLDADAIREVAE